MLVAIQTHPIQYHAPVFRALQQDFGVPVTVIYGSDFSVRGYTDPDFRAHFAWDTDLLSGYSSVFLSRVDAGGAAEVSSVSTHGLSGALARIAGKATLIGGYSPHFHRAAFFYARRLGRPILFRAETYDDGRSGAVKRWARSRALAILYSQCDRLLYIGARSRAHFANIGCPSSKLVFAPYCVDLTPFRTTEADRECLRLRTRDALGFRDDDLVLLFSGKLTDVKRPRLLLEAVWTLWQRGVHVHILFVGDGPQRDALQARAGEMTGPRIIFAGFKNQRELSPYFHAADLFVLPSGFEPWGLVVNEALCHGVPCVVSQAVGSGADLVKEAETGAVFETDSHAALCEALQRALPLTRSSAARERCREIVSHYSVARAAAGIAQAYREVTDARCH